MSVLKLPVALANDILKILGELPAKNVVHIINALHNLEVFSENKATQISLPTQQTVQKIPLAELQDTLPNAASDTATAIVPE